MNEIDELNQMAKEAKWVRGYKKECKGREKMW